MTTETLYNLSYEEKYNLTMDEGTPAETLAVLAKDIDPHIREAVAKNENTPADILTMLARENDKYIRAAVARNENTPADILAMLAQEKDEYIRAAVASNPNVSNERLAIFAKDENWWVRMGVAGNRNTSAETLAMLQMMKIMRFVMWLRATKTHQLKHLLCSQKTMTEVFVRLLLQIVIHRSKYYFSLLMIKIPLFDGLLQGTKTLLLKYWLNLLKTKKLIFVIRLQRT